MSFNSIEYFFRKADKDESGNLNPIEFFGALDQLKLTLSLKEKQQILQAADTNQDSII